MRRFALFLLVVGAMLGNAGCSSGHYDADPVGTWTISFDVDCNGVDGTRVWHFSADGTVGGASDDPVHWTVNGSQITITFSSGGVWSGSVAGDSSMSGTYANRGGGRGCWSGTKTSDTP